MLKIDFMIEPPCTTIRAPKLCKDFVRTIYTAKYIFKGYMINFKSIIINIWDMLMLVYMVGDILYPISFNLNVTH